MVATIANENTLFGTKIEFPSVVWTEEGPTGATKDFEEMIIRFGFVS
jgi:hypothetical protein